MKVTEIMSAKIEFIDEIDSLTEAARRMRDHDLGSLPVKDAQNELTGIVTDRDIVIRAVAQGRDPGATKVKDVMTPGAIACSSDQSVEDAAKLMEENKIRRLIVADSSRKAVGIVTLADIAEKVPGRELAGEAVKEISKPAKAA